MLYALRNFSTAARQPPLTVIPCKKERRSKRCLPAFMLTLSRKHGDSMPDSVDLFEMRRLEALSNTIFGVAMTLLAYNFPKGQVLNGVPVWSNIWATYQSQVIALLISFMVAGMFWISHQRRLA